MAKPIVVILDSSDVAVEASVLDGTATVIGADKHSNEDLSDDLLASADVALVFHTIQVNETLLKRLTKCRAIVRFGAGYDNVDTKTAASLGISVSNSPAYGTEEVADFALSLILNLYRRTTWLAEKLRTGAASFARVVDIEREAKGARRMRGQTLGLVGLGNIGTAVALRAKPFGFNVVFYDPFLSEGISKALGISRMYSLKDLLGQSDVISFHCGLSSQTKHILNADTLAFLKKGSFIVNTARGGLIDEEALAAALRSGHVSGAALDVVEAEPCAFSPPSSPLCSAPNVILTPHAAWYSDQSIVENRRTCAEEAKRALLGTTPESCLRSWVNRSGFVANSDRWSQK